MVKKLKTCNDHKRKYRTAQQARDSWYRLWAERKITIRENIEIYRCPYCHYFHLGHAPMYHKPKR